MPGLGDRIRSLRSTAGLTQAELAARVGVASQTVSRWERGTDQPRIEQARRLADALGVSLLYLMGVEERPQGRVEVPEDLRVAWSIILALRARGGEPWSAFKQVLRALAGAKRP